MKKKTMMRVPKELVRELKKLKKFKGQSYAEVVREVLDENKRRRK